MDRRSLLAGLAAAPALGVAAQVVGAAPAGASTSYDYSSMDPVIPFLWDGTLKTGSGTTTLPLLTTAQSVFTPGSGWTTNTASGGTATLATNKASISGKGTITARFPAQAGDNFVVKATVASGTGWFSVDYFKADGSYISYGSGPGWSAAGTVTSTAQTAPAGTAFVALTLASSGTATTVSSVQITATRAASASAGRPNAKFVEWRCAQDPSTVADFNTATDTWLPTVLP